MTQHIHHDLIVQWAKDTTQVVELLCMNGKWLIDPNPKWEPDCKYRIRHKHQDLIDQKAARPELIVEAKDIDGYWEAEPCSNLWWWSEVEYRLVEPAKKKVKMWQWVVQQGTSAIISPQFFVSAEDVTRSYKNKVIQRADWTEICVEEE